MVENGTLKKWASPAIAKSRLEKYGLAQLAINWLKIGQVAQLAQAKAQPHMTLACYGFKC